MPCWCVELGVVGEHHKLTPRQWEHDRHFGGMHGVEFRSVECVGERRAGRHRDQEADKGCGQTWGVAFRCRVRGAQEKTFGLGILRVLQEASGCSTAFEVLRVS